MIKIGEILENGGSQGRGRLVQGVEEENTTEKIYR